MTTNPFKVGDRVTRRNDIPGWPQLPWGKTFTVTEVGDNTFPYGVMRSKHWVRLDEATSNIIYWGIDMFQIYEERESMTDLSKTQAITALLVSGDLAAKTIKSESMIEIRLVDRTLVLWGLDDDGVWAYTCLDPEGHIVETGTSEADENTSIEEVAETIAKFDYHIEQAPKDDEPLVDVDVPEKIDPETTSELNEEVIEQVENAEGNEEEPEDYDGYVNHITGRH